jgi:uncharacterized membrane protein (DUF485 family)
MSAQAINGSAGASGDVTELMRRPELRELLADRRRFFRRAWAALGVGYAGFLVLPAVTPDIFAVRVGSGLSVGIILGVAYTVLVFVLASAYGRRARRWDALTAALAADLPDQERSHG